MKKKLVAIIITLALFISPLHIFAADMYGVELTSKGACIMDFQTGEILYQYEGYTQRVPASMTKIMSIYCVYEAIENGEITLDTVVPISDYVYDYYLNAVGESVLPLYREEVYTVSEMMDVIIVKSSNNFVIALAELICGSEAVFVERMNKKAQEMGLDAQFYDSYGIAENKITPVSMAILSRNIIKDYPDILTRSSKKSVNFHGRVYTNTNHLLEKFFYNGADGLKTGTTSAAGNCFTGTAVRNGRRMIAVTMGSETGSERFSDATKLLDFGFTMSRMITNEGNILNEKGTTTVAVMPDGNVITSMGAVVMKVEDGSEIYAFNQDEKINVAGIGNLLSAYALMDMASEEATQENVEDTINLLFENSHAAYMVFEDTAIKERINKKAESLGISPIFNDGEILLSAKEVCVLVKNMITDYPTLWEKMQNMGGFKLGVLPEGKYSICGVAGVEGNFVITVTLGSVNYESSFNDTVKLYKYGLGL